MSCAQETLNNEVMLLSGVALGEEAGHRWVICPDPSSKGLKVQVSVCAHIHRGKIPEESRKGDFAAWMVTLTSPDLGPSLTYLGVEAGRGDFPGPFLA